MATATAARAYDIGAILDDGPWAWRQKLAVCLAALAIVLDGFDGQLIGFAIPSLMRDWHASRGDFAPVIAAGLVGMGAGTVCAGVIGDRLGRKVALIGCMLLFGVVTCLIGLAPDLRVLGSLRFVAGLGLGGALPCATTMAAEFTPRRSRALAVTAAIVCFPLGGMLAGLYAAYILPALGWRGLFLLGGVLPMLLAAGLCWALPESPRYLTRHPARWAELIGFLRRSGRLLSADAAFTDTDAAEQGLHMAAMSLTGFGALFDRALAWSTVMLWAAFFACLFAVYSAFSWVPAMLTAAGAAPGVAGAGLTAYNFGGVFGALLCAGLINRFGSRWPLVVCAFGGAASALALTWVASDQTMLIIVGFGIHGLFVNAVNATLFAVSAFLYPTLIRARGTATALTVGRLGAILSAFAGAAVITWGGAPAFLDALGAAMLLAGIALLLLRGHIAAANKHSLGKSPGTLVRRHGEAN